MQKMIKLLGGDIGIAALVIAILGLIVFPVPIILIDALLAINLAVSMLLLMVVMYVPNVVSFSTFPTLLLFTTLFRLSLNIASTKSILLHADAGHVIEAFGQLVVGGNLVVGFVVFLIIAIVQFIVIAKGSERVAEVGARFTLDAMPGKQMSIDADLRAGLMTGDDARTKRSHLAMESALHGGMDGAMKFVKGDAIAGFVITFVNILGGIVVGVMYHGMTAGEAANRFAVLSIGDAMVSQIPSLLICVAAGILITRVVDEQRVKALSVGEEMGMQLGGNARALFLAAFFLLAFAAIPGFPWYFFLALSAILAFFGYTRLREDKRLNLGKVDLIPSLKREGAKASSPTILRKIKEFSSPLEVRISARTAAALDSRMLDKAFERERDLLQEYLGIPFPGIDLVISRVSEGGEYEIFLHDVPVDSGALQESALLVLEADDSTKSLCEPSGAACGMATTLWIPAARRMEVGAATVMSHEEVLARHAVMALQGQAHLFMGIQEVQWILEKATKDYPNLVAEVLKATTLIKIAEVLRRLLEEQIPIRNIRAILESLSSWGAKEKDPLMLTEYVRGDLGRFLAFRASNGKTTLDAVMLDQSVEQLIRQSIKQTPAGNFLALPPESMAQIADSVLQISGLKPQSGRAIVTSMDVRRYVRKMIERQAPWLQVYSFQELSGHIELRSLGRALI